MARRDSLIFVLDGLEHQKSLRIIYNFVVPINYKSKSRLGYVLDLFYNSAKASESEIFPFLFRLARLISFKKLYIH